MIKEQGSTAGGGSLLSAAVLLHNNYGYRILVYVYMLFYVGNFGVKCYLA